MRLSYSLSDNFEILMHIGPAENELSEKKPVYLVRLIIFKKMGSFSILSFTDIKLGASHI